MIPIHPFFNPTSRWYYPLRWSLLILLGLAIYGQTFGFSFVFDDVDFIVKNPYIKRFDLVPEMYKTYPYTRTLGFYSFALNYAFHQLNPLGYHIFNFIIHLVAVGFVWALAGIVYRITQARPSIDRLKQEIPFIIAVLFLVHPCQTQAVTYISQRFESMATVFYLGSIYCYLSARLSTSRRHQIMLGAGSIVMAMLGLLTKEVSVTLPLMMLAAEFIFFKGNRWKTSIAVIAGGCVFVLAFIQLVGTDLRLFFHFNPIVSQSHDGDLITVKEYVLTQMRVFLTFMRVLVLPLSQNLDYDYVLSKGLVQPPLTVIGMGVIGAMVYAVFKLRRHFPLIAFGMAWILITFSINLAPRANVIFEHKLYLMSFGFFLILVSILFNVIRGQLLLAKFFLTFIVTLSLLTVVRNQVWQNELTLWNDVVVKSPHKIRPHINLGSAYDRHGQFNEALSQYHQALELNPTSVEAYYGLGNIYSQQGDFIQSLANYDKAIVLNPEYTQAYYNRGNAYVKQGNFTEALRDYNKAIELNPNSPEIYNSRGNIYAQQGRQTEALLNYNKALEIYPTYADGYYNRGLLYGQQGNFHHAISDLNKAIEIKPQDADMYYNRGFAYYQLKDYTNASHDFHHAQELGAVIDPALLQEMKRDHH